MSKRVFDLFGVPDEEAQEVRNLLSGKNIQYFETPEGDYLGGAALWVDSDSEYQKARLLIDEYQRELKQRVHRMKVTSNKISMFHAITHKIFQNTIFFIFSISVGVILIYMLMCFVLGARVWD